MPRERSILRPRLLLALAALVLLPACGKKPDQAATPVADARSASEPQPESNPKLVILTPKKLAEAKIETAAAARREIAPQFETTGEVGYEEDRLAHVSPRIAGRLAQANAKLGDRVAAGATLAVLDSVELGQAKAAFLSARTREQLARQAFDRERSLYERHITSEREMLEARAAFEEAAAERQGAETTLRLYGLDDATLASLAPGGTAGSLLPVRTPIAGEVVEKHATIGELVRPEDAMFTVADLGHVWIWVDVPERELARVHRGDLAEVRADAFPEQPQRGEITYVGASLDRDTRTLRARVDVQNPSGILRPGMFARLRVTDTHGSRLAESVLAVPVDAVLRDGDERFVFVERGAGRYERVSVRLGRTGEGWVEVLDGLRDGERVATTGGFLLKSESSKADLGGED